MQQFTAKVHIQGIVIPYDQIGYTYDDPKLLYDAGIFGNQILSSRARILVYHIEILSSKAWIKAPQRFTTRVRVSRRQGWPIPEVGDPEFDLWQDTRIYSRVRMSNYIAFPTQILRLKGRVTYSKTLGIQSKARIVVAQTLQIKANILPKFFTAHLPVTFQVQQTSQRKLRVVFYTEGAIRSCQLTAKARIVQMYRSRVTGHFIVPMPTVFSTVMLIPNPVTSVRTQQTLSTRAKVVK